MLTLTDFLERIEEIAPADAKNNWFVLMEKRGAGAGRYRKGGLASSDIRGFVESAISENNLNPEEFDVWIADNYPQIYGGNIIISSDGNVLAEFIHGNQGVMAEGATIPQNMVSATSLHATLTPIVFATRGMMLRHQMAHLCVNFCTKQS